MFLYTLSQPSYLLADMVEGYKSLVWTERFTTYGDFELVSTDVPGTMTALPIGSLVSLQDTKEVCMVETHEVTKNEDGNLSIKVSGRSIFAFLQYRSALPSLQSINDSTGKARVYGITSTLPSSLVTLIKNQIVNGVISSADIIPNMDVTTDLITSIFNTTRVIPRGNLYDAVQQWMGESTNIGIKCRRPSGATTTMNLLVTMGANRTNTITLLEANEDFKSTNYLKSNQNSINRLYGASPTQTTTRSSGTGTETGFNRKVMCLDASDITDVTAATELAMLVARSNSTLNENQGTNVLDGEVSPTVNYVYNSDYFLGDTVNCITSYGVVQPMVVSEYIRIDDENGSIGYPALTSTTP